MRLAVAIAVPLTLALAGCEPESVSFEAVNVRASAGGDGINLNDEIAIQFNQELDPASVCVESLRVIDGSGRRLKIRARAANDVVFIAPTDPEGWPADTRLVVEVPYPWLSRPIRSSLGQPNEVHFRADVGTGRRYAARGGALRLLYHSLPLSDGTDVTEDAEFLFELDGALDPASLAEGVVLDDLTHREPVLGFVSRLVSPRRLSVLPFAGPAFRSGTRYRLTLTAALRAEDTRRLAEPVSFLFTTTKSRSGEHTTDFRPDHLIDPSLKPEKGPLVPLLKTEGVAPAVGVTDQQLEPFGREPSKVQILIHKDRLRLPDGSIENAIITAMSFRVFSAGPTSLRLSARLDYAADRHADDLGREFEDNWNLPASRQRDLIGAEGDIHVLDPQDGVLTFEFTRPFFYEVTPGKERSLVLEIVNESGIINDSAGIALLGESQPESSPPTFVAASGDWIGEGSVRRFVPALSFSIQRVRTVLVKPWTVSTVSDPEYFRRQDQFVATPGFANFKVEYRALDGVSDQPGDGGWTSNLSDLNGQRTIQARVSFLLRSAEPLSKDAGLLRLTVPFRERGEPGR